MMPSESGKVDEQQEAAQVLRAECAKFQNRRVGMPRSDLRVNSCLANYWKNSSTLTGSSVKIRIASWTFPNACTLIMHQYWHRTEVNKTLWTAGAGLQQRSTRLFQTGMDHKAPVTTAGQHLPGLGSIHRRSGFLF